MQMNCLAHGLRDNNEYRTQTLTSALRRRRYVKHCSMSKTLGLDLASKRQRERSDYTYREDYRTRWYVKDHVPTTVS
jgi:hypothetical protein